MLEQNIFYVNQVMRFGKLLAVFQANPADANKTVVTAFMALAISASVLDQKKISRTFRCCATSCRRRC